MPKVSQSRENMITAAAELFRARGFHGIGLAEILEKSGAPKGSFYHHFPAGKDELALAVIDNGGRFVSKFINASFESAATVDDAVLRFTNGIAYAFKESGFILGCPITSILLDLAPGDELIREAGKEVLETWITKMTENAMRLGVSDSVRPAYEKAFRVLLIAIEGGWIVARATNTIAPIMLAQDTFTNTLNSELEKLRAK